MKKEGEWLPGSRQSLLVRDRLHTDPCNELGEGKPRDGVWGQKRRKEAAAHGSQGQHGHPATRLPLLS